LEYFFINNAITCVQIKDNNSEYSYNDTLVVVTYVTHHSSLPQQLTI